LDKSAKEFSTKTGAGSGPSAS